MARKIWWCVKITEFKKYFLTKKLQIGAFFVRGIDQIRTDVQAFAELCLAARPRYLYANRNANIKKYFTSPHFL